MANKIQMAVASIVIALTATSTLSASQIRNIAHEYGIDENTVNELATELLEAQKVAENDMND